MATNGELQRLPLLQNTPIYEREVLFIQKLQQCCVLFDFATEPLKDMNSKVVKEMTLNELHDYIFKRSGVITEAIYPAIVFMFSCNVFRTLPAPKPGRAEFVPEANPHLLLVYKFFFACLESPDLEPKKVKCYVDEKFVQKLLELFDSKDKNERVILKKILHNVYGRFFWLREYIRKQIINIFYWFIYVSNHHNGMVELLEVIGSIIHGFSVPLKEEHIKCLLTVIMSLHKAKSVDAYLPQLLYCIEKFLEKDSTLVKSVVNSLLRIWPKVHSRKEILFLKELEEIIVLMKKDEFPKVMVPVFKQLAKCMSSPHRAVAECALLFWNNDYIMSLVNDHITVLLPVLFPSLYKNVHWHNSINGLIYNALKRCMEMNQKLFDEYVKGYELYKHSEEIKTKEREDAWSKLETLASFNLARAPLNAYNMSQSESANLLTPIEKPTEDGAQLFVRKNISPGNNC